MTSMKKAPKKKMKTLRNEVCCGGEEEKYPYGLQITLNKDELDKLGIKIKEYSVKDKVDFVCTANITEISASDNINYDEQRESIRLQITDMAIKPKEMKSKFK